MHENCDVFFIQEFTYKIPVNELATKTLHVSVWDHDVGRSNDFIGNDLNMSKVKFQSYPKSISEHIQTSKMGVFV